MPLRRLIFLSSLLLTVGALSPPAALGAAKGTDRPLRGTSTVTANVNLATGTGTTDGTFLLTHLGKGTLHADSTSFSVTGNTFAFTDTVVLVAANGDKVFGTDRGVGTLTSTGQTLSIVGSITGGTGRFADASGTFTITSRSVGVNFSIVGLIATQTYNDTWDGQISYKRHRPGRGSRSAICSPRPRRP
jgi:hypothetical protein